MPKSPVGVSTFNSGASLASHLQPSFESSTSAPTAEVVSVDGPQLIHISTLLDEELGPLRVASSGSVMLAAEFCEGALESSFEELLRKKWPTAQLDAGRKTSTHCDSKLKALKVLPSTGELSVETIRSPLKIAFQGTEFQKKVWSALLDIPAGQVVSYKQLAEYIGCESSVRAVASAVARNPVAYFVPCHRVIGSDGKLNGYRWGVECKAALLGRELLISRS